jgi:hypothetical protein
MLCELGRSPAPRRSLCWYCARLDIRDIFIVKRADVSYTCGWHKRAPRVDRCEFFQREPGADDRAQRPGRWRVAGIAL